MSSGGFETKDHPPRLDPQRVNHRPDLARLVVIPSQNSLGAARLPSEDAEIIDDPFSQTDDIFFGVDASPCIPIDSPNSTFCGLYDQTVSTGFSSMNSCPILRRQSPASSRPDTNEGFQSLPKLNEDAQSLDNSRLETIKSVKSCESFGGSEAEDVVEVLDSNWERSRLIETTRLMDNTGLSRSMMYRPEIYNPKGSQNNFESQSLTKNTTTEQKQTIYTEIWKHICKTNCLLDCLLDCLIILLCSATYNSRDLQYSLPYCCRMCIDFHPFSFLIRKDIIRNING